ncbi:OLC1v1012948C4 [Oldenlandia corymbosa var. corymbosa]|nr:OLC1v1012948C4 [Oldenlandia corymbosa var. corymbosa]
MLRHLDKENELLTVAYKSMSDELHKLQVEEEMLMRKFYEFMSAQGPSKKAEDDNEMQVERDSDNSKVQS